MTAVDSRRGAAVPVVSRPRRSARQVVSAYVALTKPRIIELLLVTTVPTMLLAEGGVPPLWLVAATLVGGALAVSPREALVFGLVLGSVSVGWLAVTTGWLPAVLALGAIAFYVGVYTMALKRRTPQNIVWGGAAGCMPVLIGWSAVTGSLAWTPVVLFGVIFFWTPPHYWPLSMRFRDDYAAAGVPMLPVVRGNIAVGRQIVAYSWLMVVTSLLLWPVAGTTPFYGVAALVLGGVFLREAHALLARARAQARAQADGKPFPGASVEAGAMRLFHGSITYLTLLFLAVAIDPLLPF